MRVRDGYASLSTSGNARSLLSRAELPICRTNVIANDRACTRVTLPTSMVRRGRRFESVRGLSRKSPAVGPILLPSLACPACGGQVHIPGLVGIRRQARRLRSPCVAVNPRRWRGRSRESPCRRATVVVWLGDSVTPSRERGVSHPRGCSSKRAQDVDTFPGPRRLPLHRGSRALMPAAAATFSAELLWRIMSSSEARSPFWDSHLSLH